MATIANLAVKVSADGSLFVKTMDQVEKKIKKTEEGGKKLATAMKFVKGALVAAVAALAVGGIADIAKGLIDDLKVARSIDVDVASIQNLRLALISVGSDGERAGDILTHLSKSIANASVGLDPALADTFKRLELDASSLAAAKPEIALERIAKKIGAIPDPAKRAAAAYAIFGENAAAILPVINDGTKRLDDAAASADKFGGNISNIEASRIEAVANQFKEVQELIKLAAQRLIVEFIPFLMEFVTQLSKATDISLRFSDVAKAMALLFAYFIATIVEAFKFVGLFLEFAKLGVLGFVRIVLIGFKKILEQGARLPDRLGGKEFRDALSRVSDWEREVGDSMRDTIKDINDSVDKFGTSFKKVDDALDAATKKADAMGKAVDKAAKAGGAVPIVNRFAELFKKGAEVTREMRTPLENFKDKTLELNALVKAGAISWDTYSKATAGAVAELEKAHELQNLSAPKAILKNTAEAASAINRDRLQQAQFREKPEDRVRRVLEESKKIEEEQLKQQRKIAGAVANVNIVRF